MKDLLVSTALIQREGLDEAIILTEMGNNLQRTIAAQIVQGLNPATLTAPQIHGMEFELRKSMVIRALELSFDLDMEINRVSSAIGTLLQRDYIREVNWVGEDGNSKRGFYLNLPVLIQTGVIQHIQFACK